MRARAAVNFDSDHSVVVQYSGSGLLDPNSGCWFEWFGGNDFYVKVTKR